MDAKVSPIDMVEDQLQEQELIDNPNKMAETTFQGVVTSEIQDAIDYIDNNISDERNLASQSPLGS